MFVGFEEMKEQRMSRKFRTSPRCKDVLYTDVTDDVLSHAGLMWFDGKIIHRMQFKNYNMLKGTLH